MPNDFTTYAASRREIEESVGVTPMHILEAKLAENERAWAEGSSLFGPGGLANDQRKAFLSTVACKLRDGWDDTRHGKCSEAALDRYAHADAGYGSFLDGLERKRTDWLLLNAERDGLLMTARRDDAILRMAGRGV